MGGPGSSTRIHCTACPAGDGARAKGGWWQLSTGGALGCLRQPRRPPACPSHERRSTHRSYGLCRMSRFVTRRRPRGKRGHRRRDHRPTGAHRSRDNRASSQLATRASPAGVIPLTAGRFPRLTTWGHGQARRATQAADRRTDGRTRQVPEAILKLDRRSNAANKASIPSGCTHSGACKRRRRESYLSR
jgi:hypothetical protein